MKSVLISIQPKWCELIASGKKTVEVRKTKPKLDTPFKVYIYCTANKQGVNDLLEVHGTDGKIRKANGKVIGEFVCREITVAELGGYWMLPQKKTLIDPLDLMDYADDKALYGWHISDLVMYDKPRELSEFHKPTLPTFLRYEDDVIKRPPQSWCYVESEGDPFCDAYCGVACVDGSCPKIENKQYHCVDCWLYKGCKDCCFDGDIDYCPKPNESEVTNNA